MNNVVENNDLWYEFNRMPQKRRKCNSYNYISGTEIKNYLLNDPVLDWFEQHYTTSGLNNEKTTRNRKKRRYSEITKERENLSLLFEQGNSFEEKVSNFLHEKFENDIITINLDNHSNAMTHYNFNKTIDAMMNGVPIIEQAVLFNNQNNTRGIADLVVRSDYLNKIVKRSVLSQDEETYKAPFLNGNYHYRVIDIKWSSMTLCSNGITIRNEDRYPAYKGQLAIYNNAIGLIQGYIPCQTYILAKSWKIDKKNDVKFGYDCFDLLGTIDYNTFDKPFVEKTINAINWKREVKTEGHLWNPFNPHRKELYPNMCNRNDAPWCKLKQKLADDLSEITQIWYVNQKNRELAHNAGIMSWKDIRCTSKVLGITGDRCEIIDKILNINRNDNIMLEPNLLTLNTNNWQQREPLDFYTDFENINMSLFNRITNIRNSKSEADVIFMIGVGYIQNNEWQYKVFTCNKLTIDYEKTIVTEFINFINEKSLELDPEKKYKPRLFHWTQAEKIVFSHASQRHNNIWDNWQNSVTWIDMYEIFVSEPIVVKGALNFKLKSIGKAMYKLGLITTAWNDEIGDGFVAMMDGIKYYKEIENNDINNINNNTNNNKMNSIVAYNEVDCKVIWDIVKYLRNNHCIIRN